MRSTQNLLLVFALLSCPFSSFAQQPQTVVINETERSLEETSFSSELDPFEGWNRKVYAFNQVFDRWLFRPMAVGYRAVTPGFVRQGMSNFFNNLDDVMVSFNALLQGKFSQSGQDFSRFLINTTLGVAGFFDVAKKFDLQKHNEDFGQTLAVWGIGQGPYLVMPFFDATNPRDFFGSMAQGFIFDPVNQIDHMRTQNQFRLVNVVVIRESFLAAESLITGDPYTFRRDAYLQRRDFLINDGLVEDDFLDDFDDFEEEAEAREG